MKKGLIVFVFGILCFSFAGAFSGLGTGTLADPYQITDCSELNETRDDLTGNYSLVNDIDCGGFDYGDGNGWKPIGDYLFDDSFNGTFEGQGFKIIDLNISRGANNYVGLFSYVLGNISNLVIEDLWINGYIGVGGVAGALDGWIVNCSVEGIVFDSYNHVGGIVGSMSSTGRVISSSVNITVVGDPTNFGGLVGLLSGEIYNSSSIIFIDSSSGYCVGGAIGQIDTASSFVDNCNTSGSIVLAGGSNVGGFVGCQWGGEINNSFSDVLISTDADTVGGFAGDSDSISSIYNSHAIRNVSGANTVGGFVGTLWDYGIIYNSYATGNVSGDSNSGGFAGYLWDDTFTNNSYATGDVSSCSSGNCGGFTGYVSGFINNSYANGSVTSTGANIGGFVGYQDMGSAFFNCYSTGNVSGDSFAGGFVGYVDGSEITNCYSTGSVLSCPNGFCGGFTGTVDSPVYNSYSTGDVFSVANFIGGFAGSIYGLVENSYSTGNVTGVFPMGGFAGEVSGASIANSYWNNVSGNVSVGTGPATGIFVIQDDANYFYNVNNLPLVNWSFPPWSLQNNGTDFPIFVYSESSGSSDSLAPTINVLSPLNQTYTSTTIWFNATADESIDTWWVNFNGTNITLSSINSSMIVTEGTYALKFYGDDSSGNVGLNDSFSFIVELPEETISPVVEEDTGGGWGGGGGGDDSLTWDCKEWSECVSDSLEAQSMTSVVAHFPLDGNLRDVVNLNYGESSNVGFVEGVSGQGTYFNGEDSYVVYDRFGGLNFAPGSFSISAWVKPNTLSYPQIYTAIAEYDRWDAGGPAKSWFGIWIKNGGEFHFRVGHDRDWASTINSNQKMDVGQWNFLTATYDSKTSTSAVYINGVKQGERVVSVKGFYSQPTESYFTIGSSKYRSGFVREFFDGVIDEVTIYEGALSEENVASLYSSGGENFQAFLDYQEGSQTRECVSNVNTQKTEERTCYVGCSPKLVCSSWSECLDDEQERYCEDVECNTGGYFEFRDCVENC